MSTSPTKASLAAAARAIGDDTCHCAACREASDPDPVCTLCKVALAIDAARAAAAERMRKRCAAAAASACRCTSDDCHAGRAVDAIERLAPRKQKGQEART